MFFVPYEKVTINSPLNYKKVKSKLASEIAPVITYLVQVKATDKLFKGIINDYDFEMMRVVSSRNSFLPFVKGRIVEEKNGSKIIITMLPTLVTLLVMSVFFIFAGCIEITILYRGGAFVWSDLIPLAFILFLYIYMTAIFKDEADLVKYNVVRMVDSDEFDYLKIDDSYTV